MSAVKLNLPLGGHAEEFEVVYSAEVRRLWPAHEGRAALTRNSATMEKQKATEHFASLRRCLAQVSRRSHSVCF